MTHEFTQQGNATLASTRVSGAGCSVSPRRTLFRGAIFAKLAIARALANTRDACATQTANVRRASRSGSEMLRAEAICLPLWEHQLGVHLASQLTRRAL